MSDSPETSSSPPDSKVEEKEEIPKQEEDKEEDEEKEGEEEDGGTIIEPILDGRNITFQTRTMNQYLLCSLCMGYFKDAHTISECLHTFCKSCIFKFFMENTDCPTCGISLLPFPLQTVRVDRTLQSIVDKIFPDLIRKDLEQEKFFYVSRGMPVPESLLEEEGKLKPPTEAPEPAPAPKRLKKGEGNKRIYNDEVAFELAVDESSAESVGLPKLDKPFIRTSAKITVFHLKKFLSKKLNLKSTNEIEISYKGEILGSEHSLEYILKTRGVDPSSKGPTFVYRKKKAELGI
jgi:hypothetical protein